ncbi:MAG TPA: hypothetical protein VGJ96_14560 [Gemmatimonadaceae bacterium]|jgi:hypothetical protein
MDVLVMVEEQPPEHSSVLAHVSSVPSPLTMERPSRDVVTLYGVPSPESLALALAAALESRRSADDRADTVRHVGVWPERGAVGDAAWRDEETGELVTRDLQIPLAVLAETAQALLLEGGQAIRRLVGGLRMPDWPEGTRRAVSFSFTPTPAFASAATSEAVLAVLREAEGLTYDLDADEN